MLDKKKKIIEKYNKLPIQVKASFWFLFCVILQKGISVLTTPIFTRLLGAANYGEYSLFNSWQGIIAVFVTFRLTYGVYTQGLVKFEDKREEFSVAMQGLSSFIIAIYFIIYLFFSEQFNSLFSLNTYQMLSMFVILWSDAIFSFWLCEQRVDYKYKRLVIITVIVSIIKPLFGIFAVTHFEDQVTARIISIAVVNLLFYTPFIIGKIRIKKPFYSKKIWKYAILFNLPLIPHYLSQTVLNKADVIMIGKIIGSKQAGIYNLSYSLAMLLLIINTAMMQTMTPWMYRKMKSRQIEDIKGIAYLSLIAIAFLNLFLIVFAPEIIKIFAPPEFMEAIWVIPPIAMSGVFIFSYDLFSSYEFYYEKTVFVMTASIVVAIINIVLNLIFINKFGYIAAGYTTLVCYIFYALGHYIFMNKICRIEFEGKKPYDFKILLLIYLTFLLVGFSIMFTYHYFMIRMLYILILISIVFIFRNKLISFAKQMMVLRKG